MISFEWARIVTKTEKRKRSAKDFRLYARVQGESHPLHGLAWNWMNKRLESLEGTYQNHFYSHSKIHIYAENQT